MVDKTEQSGSSLEPPNKKPEICYCSALPKGSTAPVCSAIRDGWAARQRRDLVAYEGIPIARDVVRVQSTAQPLSGTVQFERNGEAARQQLIKDAERIGQAMM